jgi:hypothetical protein
MRSLLNGGTLSGRSAVASLSFPQQVRALETFLGRELPERVRDLFQPGSSTARRLLVPATGREFDPPTPDLSPGDAFAEAQANFDSVLGHAIMNAEAARFDPNYLWPAGLMIVEDRGCAVYRGLDLNSPQLRVIEYEHFEPVEDPQAAVGAGVELAFLEPLVPKGLQHQFVVVTATLDEWLRSLKAGR